MPRRQPRPSRVARRHLRIAYTRDKVVEALQEEGIWPGKIRPDSKDYRRVEDMDYKAGRDPAKLLNLASRMAKSIKKVDKAIRRGRAAFEYHKRSTDPKAMKLVAQIFYARALELGGLPARYPNIPKSSPAKKPKFKAPNIPANLVPTDSRGWQLYTGEPGASRAAKDLGKIMLSGLKMLGNNVSPYNTTAKNVKAVQAVLKKMDAARDRRAEWGAADTEPRGVVKDIVEDYLSTYMDKWDHQEVFDAVDYW